MKSLIYNTVGNVKKCNGNSALYYFMKCGMLKFMYTRNVEFTEISWYRSFINQC